MTNLVASENVAGNNLYIEPIYLCMLHKIRLDRTIKPAK